MNNILDNTDVLYQIINKTEDIQDWISFMSTHRNISKYIYPKFLLRKFMFVKLRILELPKCIENNDRIKLYGRLCFISQENIVVSHSRFSGLEIFETYGFFAQNLIVFKSNYVPDNSFNYDFDIDYTKILSKLTSIHDYSDINISDFEFIKKSWDRKSKNLNGTISFHKSLTVTTKYINSFQFNFREKNFKRLFGKRDAFCHGIRNESPISQIPYEYPTCSHKICLFCKSQVNEDEIKKHEVISNLTGHSHDIYVYFENHEPSIR